MSQRGFWRELKRRHVYRVAVAYPDLAAEVMWSPMLEPIRNDPRFKAVLKKMGLPYVPPETKAQ